MSMNVGDDQEDSESKKEEDGDDESHGTNLASKNRVDLTLWYQSIRYGLFMHLCSDEKSVSS